MTEADFTAGFAVARVTTVETSRFILLVTDMLGGVSFQQFLRVWPEMRGEFLLCRKKYPGF
jgi:hypothetical protein